MSPFREVKEGVRIAVRVQPRASKSECAGHYGRELRIRLAAPPVDGAANEALVRFLAEALGVPARRVTITGGLASRSKAVLVEGVSARDAAERLGAG